jgi:hypothetical protein
LEEVAVADSSGLEELPVGLLVEVIASIVQGSNGCEDVGVH